jgi:hypothetical protein
MTIRRDAREACDMSASVCDMDASVEDTSAAVEGVWLLSRGIKSLLVCDEAEVVRGIARYVMSQHRSLRLGSALMERTRQTPLPALMALLGALTRFLEVHPGEREGGAVWVARLGNERRAIEPFPALLPELDWTELTFRWRPRAAALAALARVLKTSPGSAVRRIGKLARRLHRRHEFFKVLRVVELVGYYTRYLGIFREGGFRLALMSSHSNPHGIAFNLAARRCGVPVVLITHGMPVRPVAKLSFDLAVVHCEAARQTYLEAGCRMDRVLIHGRQQHHSPMPAGSLPERLSVGIFLCKDVNEGRLRAVVARLAGDPRVSRILVRPHPKNLWLGLDAWVASFNDPRVCRSPDGPVFRDVEASDIVLAGNSSVLVEALTAGRPAGYVPGLDYGSQDLHAFVARGLVYQFEDERGFDPDAMLRFYQRPNWPDVLRLFANVDEDEASVASRVCAALRELAASREASAGNQRKV